MNLEGIRLMVYNPQKIKGSVGTGSRRKNKSNGSCPAIATITIACMLYPIGYAGKPAQRGNFLDFFCGL